MRDRECNQTHRPMNRAPTIKSRLSQEDRILRGGNRVFGELVLWERNSLRERECNQTHRPMNRAPTIKSRLSQEDRILRGENRVLGELVLWERNLLRERECNQTHRPILDFHHKPVSPTKKARCEQQALKVVQEFRLQLREALPGCVQQSRSEF